MTVGRNQKRFHFISPILIGGPLATTFGTERRGFSPGAECQKSELRTVKYGWPDQAKPGNVGPHQKVA